MVTWPIAWRIHSNCNNGVSRLLSVGGELISEAVCSLSLIRCVSTWSLRCHHARTTARAAIYLLSQETAHEHSHQCSFLSLRMWCRQEMYPRPHTPHPTPLFGSSSYEHNRLISLQWWTSIVGKISRTQTHNIKLSGFTFEVVADPFSFFDCPAWKKDLNFWEISALNWVMTVNISMFVC